MGAAGPQTAAAVPPKLSNDSPSGRINVIATEELLQRIEEWRAAQRPIPNKSEAARMLIERALNEDAAALNRARIPSRRAKTPSKTD